MSAPVTLSWVAPNPTYFAPLQLSAVAAPLTLVSAPSVEVPLFERTVSLTSEADNSAVNFTIVGKNVWMEDIQEVLAGPNANTVESVNSYHVVSSITSSAGFVGLSAGTGTGGSSIWVRMNNYSIAFDTVVSSTISGTVSYSVYSTTDPITRYPFMSYASIAKSELLADQAASSSTEIISPITGIQVTYTKNAANTGTVRTVILQQGTL